MGFYAERVVPRLNDLLLRGEQIEELRRRATAGLAGEVLEVGFGSGRNVPHYPPEVTRVQAVEPAARGRQLAAARLARSAVPVELVGLRGEDLPLGDATVDHVLSTWTLCTIGDVDRALREMCRVLRPGGVLHFVEHGLAPDADVARWQDRLTPVQRRACAGCHLNRPIDRLVSGAGFDVADLENRYVGWPRSFTYLYLGRAAKPSRAGASGR